MSGSNLPVPDQLAATRAEIKRLQDLESELKRVLITDPASRTGVAWLADIKVVRQQRVDLKELKACHPDIVAEQTHPHEVTYVTLSGIDEHGEIVPARQFRKETAQ